MSRRLFYRNAQARDNLELFLVAAITSLLLLRFFLKEAGYPQVGGGSLHIAHMLYGGLLMMVAVVMNLSFIGVRIQRLSALLGGIGFGVFIDELGKFITKNNNYFFKPTVGIIYAVFVILYLAFNFISRKQRLSSEEYQLNALRQFEEAVVHNMDRTEKATMKRFLARADDSSPITRELLDLLKRVEPVPAPSSWLERQGGMIAVAYKRFWRRESVARLVGGVFVVETIVFVLAVGLTFYHSFSSIHELLHTTNVYGTKLIIGQLVASVVAAGFAVVGAVKLPGSRPEAFEWFRRAILVNLFLTEFFIFSRIQFGALPGFLVNLVLLGALRFAQYQEQRA
jgi:hypothetical protein